MKKQGPLFLMLQHNAPSVVVKDMKEAKELAKYITGEKPLNDFTKNSENQYSAGI